MFKLIATAPAAKPVRSSQAPVQYVSVRLIVVAYFDLDSAGWDLERNEEVVRPTAGSRPGEIDHGFGRPSRSGHAPKSRREEDPSHAAQSRSAARRAIVTDADAPNLEA